MRIHYLQHVSFEDLGSIGHWTRAAGHAVTRTRLYAADPLPEIDAFDWLIVMGGTIGASDDAALPSPK